MITRKVTVNISSGLHFRPAERITTIAMEYPCSITLKKANSITDMKSFLSVLAANVKAGEKVTIECNGEQEKEAMEKIAAFLEQGIPKNGDAQNK